MKWFRKVLPGHALILGMLLCSPTVWADALSITTSGTLPQGLVGAAYSTTLAATGGTTPYIWQITYSALPTGLNLSGPSGSIAGTPTMAGTYGFIATVTDHAGATSFKPFSIVVLPAAVALSITTSATLPDAKAGTGYSQTLAATGGTPPYVWSLTSGTTSLPAGLALSSSGIIAGTPTTQGSSTFTVQVKDSASTVDTRDFSLTVDTPGPARSGVVSQVASGGGWKTSLYLINASTLTTPVQVTVKFWSDTGTALSLPLTVTQAGSAQSSIASSVTTSVARNTTLLIESNSQATVESVGWAEVISAGSVTGYGIFHFTSSSGVESEGTVPLQTTFGPSFILPYDATDGFQTGVALANLSAAQANVVTATVYDASGKQLATKTISLAKGGHTSFMLADTLPSTISNRGIVEFKSASTSNGLNGLGLRVSPVGGFASIPTLQRP